MVILNAVQPRSRRGGRFAQLPSARRGLHRHRDRAARGAEVRLHEVAGDAAGQADDGAAAWGGSEMLGVQVRVRIRDITRISNLVRILIFHGYQIFPEYEGNCLEITA